MLVKADANAFVRKANRWSDELLPRRLSEALMHCGEAGDRPGHTCRDRSVTRRLAGKHVARRRRRSDFAKIDRPHRVRGRFVIDEKSAAADVSRFRVSNGERECYRDGGIDRIAPSLHHREPDLRRVW